MDEQTTSQQENNYDISADGAANQGYEEEPLQGEQTEAAEPEKAATPETGELSPDGVRLNEDGTVEFGDDFFGEMGDIPEDEPKQPEQPEQQKAEAPQYYTDEELNSIPFQQWDLSRLNGDVGKFALIVQRQLQQAQIQARSQAWENVPLPSDITEPKAYTPKELSDDALKLACEKLGIKDVDEFDSYEREHQAAYQIALQELNQRRNAEISGYQNALNSWRENAKYQDELTRRSDFYEFDQWYVSECLRAGCTPQQVNERLHEMVKQNGNNFGLIKQVIEGWYQEFQKVKAARNPAVKSPAFGARTAGNPGGMRNYPKTATSRTTVPPVLESTRGNNYVGKPSIRAEAFADMSSDEQAKALMKLGFV
ncbi:MAG: hypothetical protein II877_04730 [Synergistaceae bacterium]|nr:hypothetical protein [Synergistaceae bacterium]